MGIAVFQRPGARSQHVPNGWVRRVFGAGFFGLRYAPAEETGSENAPRCRHATPGSHQSSILKRFPNWIANSRRHEDKGRKQKLFDSFMYKADSWDRARRVIVKAEHNSKGANTRCVVTNLPQSDRHLYTRVYRARGEMENRIKNQQLDLFADRASCRKFWPNQFRQLLSGLAYTLFEALRRMALAGTRLALTSPNTIRLTLLRVGAVVLANTRRIRLLLSSAYAHHALFRGVALRLDSL